MIPRIEKINGKKLIGKCLTMSLAGNRTGELWGSFMPRRKEIKNNLTNDMISLQVYKLTHFTILRFMDVLSIWCFFFFFCSLSFSTVFLFTLVLFFKVNRFVVFFAQRCNSLEFLTLSVASSLCCSLSDRRAKILSGCQRSLVSNERHHQQRSRLDHK